MIYEIVIRGRKVIIESDTRRCQYLMKYETVKIPQLNVIMATTFHEDKALLHFIDCYVILLKDNGE